MVTTPCALSSQWNPELENLCALELKSHGVPVADTELLLRLLEWAYRRRFFSPFWNDNSEWSFYLVSRNPACGPFALISAWHSGSRWSERTPVLQIHFDLHDSSTSASRGFLAGLPDAFSDRRKRKIRNAVTSALPDVTLSRSSKAPEIPLSALRVSDGLQRMLRANDESLYGL